MDSRARRPLAGTIQVATPTDLTPVNELTTLAARSRAEPGRDRFRYRGSHKHPPSQHLNPQD